MEHNIFYIFHKGVRVGPKFDSLDDAVEYEESLTPFYIDVIEDEETGQRTSTVIHCDIEDIRITEVIGTEDV